ncbi:MAG: WXG100 family type VII secretion target, partial [Anaerolineae bacterium]|nr:WXG100 family type VII secretion target [Anaerolineae bacterium]
MSSAVIQVQYEQLEQIARSFTQINTTLTTHHRRFKQTCEQLKTHGWEGEGADEFFKEVEETVLPRVQRLLSALEQSAQAVRQISDTMADAEDSAAEQMRGAVITGVFPAVSIAKPITGPSDDRGSAAGESTTFVSYTPTPPPDSTAQADPNPQDVLNNPGAYTEEQIAAALAELMTFEVIVDPGPPPTTRTIQLMNNANGDSFNMVVTELAQAIHSGQVDGPSVMRLITTAQNEIASGAAYSPAGAALYMLAIADDQPDLNVNPAPSNTTQFEDLTGLQDYAQSVFPEGGPNGGNCANSASAAYYFGAGMAEYTGDGVGTWGLGENTNNLYAGTSAFRSVRPLDDIMRNRAVRGDTANYTVYQVGGSSSSYYGHEGARIAGQGNWGFPATDDGVTSFNNVGPGDLLFIYQGERLDGGVAEHMGVIVGWGGEGGGPGSPFYPTYDEAVAAGVSDPTPYAVDHGGTTAQGYPRPIDQVVTSGEYIYIADVEPMITGTP